jgi:tetratricopeptide (TPR) repeat protein
MTRVSSFLSNKTFLFILNLLFGLIILVVSFQKISDAIDVNIWSINFYHSSIHAKNVSLASPPGDHRRSLFWLAQEAYKNNDVIKALNLLQDSDGLDRNALRLLGKVLLAHGQIKEAINIWKMGRDLDNLIQFAQISIENRDYQNALRAYQAAYDLDKEKTALHYAKFLQRYMDDQEKARDVLQEVLALYPHSPYQRVWTRHLGDIFRESENWSDALKVYQNIVSEESPDAESVAAYIGMGWVYYHLGHTNKAINEFMKATSIEVSEEDAYFALGQLYVNEEKYAEAIDALKLALQSNPNHSDIHHLLAWSFYMQEKYEGAIIHIERVMALDQSNVNYYLRAGLIYEAVGNVERALEMYQSVLKINPKNQTAVERIQEMENK